MNKTTKKLGLASIGTGMAVVAGNAAAALDAGVTTAITDGGADAKLMGAAVLVVIVGIFAIKLLRKAI